MKGEYFGFEGVGGKLLPAVIWRPGKVRAVLQVVHGTTEHMGRYRAFAETMAAFGVAVAGFDLRGHGRNPGDPDVVEFQPGDWQASVQEAGLFHEHLRREFPGVPVFLLGFSLGSFVVRDLLNTDFRPAGVVLVGTGHQPGWLLSIMRRIVAGQIRKVGFDKPSALVRKLSFGVYNDKFKPNRTEVDWLSADEAVVDDYLADPLVRRKTSAGMFWELLGSMQRRSDPKEYDHWDKELPVLLISGDQDPVGGAGKGVAMIYQQMTRAGMNHVTLKLIPNSRHAILMSKAGEAEKMIGDWVTDCIIKVKPEK